MQETLEPAVEAVARENARRDGRTFEEYWADVQADRVNAKDQADLALAPFRQAVKDSGMTEDELTALFEEAREAVDQESLRTKS